MLLKRYAVVFTGDLAQGVSRDQARQTLAQKFGIAEPQLDKLFCGKRVVIKRGVDRGNGLVLKNKFESAGMVCALVELPPPADAAAQQAQQVRIKEYDWPEPPPPVRDLDKSEDDSPDEPVNVPGAAPRKAPRAASKAAPRVAPRVSPDDAPEVRPRAAKRAVTVAAEAASAVPMPDVEAVVPAMLRRHGPKKGAYPGLEVPPDKFKNALSNLDLTGDDTIHGVLDASGDCSACLVFTGNGVNLKTMNGDVSLIPYRDYVELKIAVADKASVQLGDEYSLRLPKKGAPMSAKQYAIFLLQVQEELIKSMLKAAR